ncbi:MAG: 3-dehydroquinate synthase II [Nitrososphaerales archaeon]
MRLIKSKELIVSPTVSKKSIGSFLSQLKQEGVKAIYADPKKINKFRDSFNIIYHSEDADSVVCRDLNAIKRVKKDGKIAGFYIKVTGKKDEDIIVQAANNGADFVIVDAKNWKIIPLENIIAKLQKTRTKVYTIANSSEEVRTMFSVLQLGVDGVILNTANTSAIRKSMIYLGSREFPLKPAKVLEIKDVGIGERVCVDTASILNKGEGMLIGSRSNFMFLIHNESVGSAFTSPRPFRVNAGAVHCYTLMPDGNTKYLSEVEAGDEVLVVDTKGRSRRVAVGRSKVETRPMRLIKAALDGEVGSIIVQNAETIRFVGTNGKLIPVTEVKKGDSVLVHAKAATGRHFGMEVEEYIVEK